MELKQVSGNTWCLMGHQLIPIYRTDMTHCIMMDTGAAFNRTELVQTLEENHLIPIGLLCTHTHFDHFGNARFLSEKYHCPVALPLGEAEICRTLDSVKSHLYVYPHGQIANDPKMAEIPCIVDHVIRPEEKDTMFRGVRFRVLHTPGHALDHCSYITPDGVCYIGDALMCGKSLTGSQLPYSFHFSTSLRTIEELMDIQCEAMVVAHQGILYEGFRELAEQNLSVMKDRLAKVTAMVDHPMTADEVCRAVCRNMGVRLTNPEKAQNLERFLRPYLEHMVDTGTHRLAIIDDSLCYEPVNKKE